MDNNRKSLGQLFFPIFLEILLFMLTGAIDTLMLSSVGDQAVAAVGTANTYIGMFILMFSIISSGMMAVMTQNIGAGKPGVAYQASKIGATFNGTLGLILGAFLFFFGGNVLDIVGVAGALKEPAEIYLKIVGGGCFLNAIIPIYSGYLRAFGFMKQPLVGTILANLTNLILNAVFLYVFDMGVAGVAIATIVSRILNLAFVYISSRILVKAHDEASYLPISYILKQIVKIGLPSALETALYNLAMTFIMRFLNQMDPDGFNVAARSYASTITNFSFCAGAALAQANAIITGWNIGAEDYESCKKGTRKAVIIGIFIAASIETVLAFSSDIIMPLFTDDPALAALVKKLLLIDIALEIGRITNLVYVNALKVSGDATFPVVMAVIFNFLCAVGGTYYFGIHLEMLAVGAYIGLALDECVRAVAMILRWRTGIWKTKRIVN